MVSQSLRADYADLFSGSLMNDFDDILGVISPITGAVHVDEGSAQFLASDPEPVFFIFNDCLSRCNAKAGLNLTPSEESSGTSNPA